MLTKTLIAAMAVLLGTATIASADVKGRQDRQDHRIYKGVQDGTINYSEYKKLQRGQDRVERLRKAFKRNGVTQVERKVMRAYQNRQSHRIHKFRNN